MAYDGEVTIGIKARTDEFEKQIAKLQRETEKIERKKVVVQTELGVQLQELEAQKTKVEELEKAQRRLNELRTQQKTTGITAQQYTEIQAIERQYGSLVKLGNEIEKNKQKQTRMELGIERTTARIQEMTNTAEKYGNEIQSLNLQRHKKDVEELKNKFTDVGTSVQGVLLKLGRLALGVIGIRTAMSGLRRLSSELANYDSGYAAKLEYIRFALAQAIAPVLQYIVNMAGEVLALINAIFHLITGKALFGANANAKAFENMKNSTKAVKNNVGGAAKGVAEMKKQLMGFDEVNVLQENGSVGGGGGGRRR